MMRLRLLISLTMLLAACGGGTANPDDNPSVTDPGITDPSADAGVPDAGSTDAGTPDAGASDGGPVDAGPGPVDGGSSDAGTDPQPVPEVERPFTLPKVQTSLPEYVLTMPPETLAKFMANPLTEEQDATFQANGKTFPVKVRLRGASARYFEKKSWNVSFADKDKFEGRTSLNLIAEYADASMLAEKISYDLLAAMRVPASKATFVRLSVNGQYEGVFLEVEQVNKAFVKARQFPDDDATIYRAGWKDTEFKTWKVPYQGDWVKKTNESEPDDALWEVLDVINHTPEPQLVAALEKNLELESYVRSMVLDALMSNNFVEDSESYFIHDDITGRWRYVPWDLNNVDARWWYTNSVQDQSASTSNMKHPLFNFTLLDGWVEKMYLQRKLEQGSYPGYLPTFSNMGTRVVLNPVLRARLEARLDKALDELFTSKVMDPYIDQLHALIDASMKTDPYMDYAKFSAGKAYMKRFVQFRRDFVKAEVKRLKAQQSTLVMEAFDPREGWVEVGNHGTEPVSLKGMTLTTNLRVSLAGGGYAPTIVKAPTGAVLDHMTVPPGQRVRLTGALLGITFPAKGEVGLFDGTSVVGMKDALFYGELPAGKHYVRGEDGWEVR
ncbi:Inner spore coat protein H [Corallococcus sp. AB049A]|uniref:Inner spore coat protein H n=1 Tax=Corallococcus interemptor TaxID=2316720 RepID=A0A3A8QQ89_9BACT|nr:MULTISPECIES: CotH kinase family protein [Corallococcus]RKH68555.1 Inner spore coat protein H [Corallococcus interemptor]RKI60110.1 Inner spore coat protein H [Corallococcus sp. AB049A]